MSEPFAASGSAPHWLYEDGIGEQRAALLINGEIAALRLRSHDSGPHCGAILAAQVVERITSSLTLVRTDDGTHIVGPVPAKVTLGARVMVEITREPIIERDLVKRAQCRIVDADTPPRDAPSLLQQIESSPYPVTTVAPFGEDRLEQAGWSDALEQARTGTFPFEMGVLRMSLTPAMTVFDVDGTGPSGALAIAAARAMAQTIVRHDIGGNIVIDLPTMDDKAQRIAAAQAFDAAMTGAFERTAVNGYGLLQVIRPRSAMSIPELLCFQPVASAALALLRRAERAQGTGALTLYADQRLIDWLNERSHLVDELAKRSGRTPQLHPRAADGIWSFHAQ